MPAAPALALVPDRPVAAYLRLSEARDDSVSIAAQLERVTTAATLRGWGAPTLFVEEGVSGSKDVRRPKRDDLERRIVAGEFSALIVKSVDRLARSTADFARIMKCASDAGCALVVTDLGLDASTTAGRMIVEILASFAAFEAATISSRVTSSNVHRRSVGRTIGGPVPFGLRNVKRDGRPGTFREIDPEAAPVVRRMAADVTAGLSMRGLATRLNAEGVRPPRGVEGTRWDAGTVRRVLTNPALTGQTRVRGDVLRDEDGLPRLDAECVVLELEAFDALQAAVTRRGAAVPQRPPTGATLLLDGLAICGTCNGRMVRQSTASGRYVNYTCGAAARNRCDAPASASAATLDGFVSAAFLENLGHVCMTRHRSFADPEAKARLRLARAEIDRALASLAQAGPDEIADLAARLATLKRTEAAARDTIATAPLSVLEDTGETYGSRFLAADPTDFATRRPLVAAFVDRVVVHRAKPGAGRGDLAARVSIEWGTL